MWVPVFMCRDCGSPMRDSLEAALACPTCGIRVEHDGGVFRCLAAERRRQLEPFLTQYRRVRERDGYRTTRPEFYRSLPRADAAEPTAGIWRIRQRSFRVLCRELRHRSRAAAAPPAVLDLGAGNGWLSHRLAMLGCRTVAVDLLCDEADGLGACRHYDVPFTQVEADFDALPFAPGQFDVIVFNGSLHYSPDVCATLAHASTLLVANGLLAIMDSPTFVHDADGAAMIERKREQFRRDYGIASPIEPGEGFLTFSKLEGCAGALGRSARYFRSHDGWRPQLRRLIRVGRSSHAPYPPRFGVWIAA